METVKVARIDSDYLNTIPDEIGILQFYLKNMLLYVSKTPNLRKKLLYLWQMRRESPELEELFSRADTLRWERKERLLDALLYEKKLLLESEPEYNAKLPVWRNYVYLALNPAEFPFVKVTEFTSEDWIYVGPFHNRFFLKDVTELVGRILKLPDCEVSQGPCEKLDTGICRGWCVLISSATTNELTLDNHLQKLDSLLKEAYLHPKNNLLELIRHEMAKYEDNLEFSKADLFKDRLEILGKYRQWLIFLYRAKELAFETDFLTVREGQVESFVLDGKHYSCPVVTIQYRENEKLAMNKNLADDAWILYRYQQMNAEKVALPSESEMP